MKDWEILKAVADGLAVQYELRSGKWDTLDEESDLSISDLRSGEWRIKPDEPKVIYVNRIPKVYGESDAFIGYQSEEDARKHATQYVVDVAVKYIEAQE